MRFGVSKVTSRGQITIPLPIRKNKSLETGTDVVVLETNEGVLVRRSRDLEALFAVIDAEVKKSGVTKEELLKAVEQERIKNWESYKRGMGARQRSKE